MLFNGWASFLSPTYFQQLAKALKIDIILIIKKGNFIMLLVIDHHKTQVSYNNQTLCVRREEKALQRVPLRYLTQVVVYGNPQVEVAVWRALSQASIPAILLASRGSQEPALLANGLAKRLPLRLLQYRCSQTSRGSLLIAKWFVRGKIESYGVSLNQLSAIDEARCEGFWQRCEMALDALLIVKGLNNLMGIEGQISHLWFRLLHHALPAQWEFNGRNRRPPRDAVNSLLSLGYTLLATDVRQMVIAEGLDPALGFLHQQRAGREALVLDVVELFRSGVDHFVLSCLADLSPDDFTHSNTFGCRLKKSKRGYFYAKWAQYRQAWPRPFLDANKPLPDTWPCAPLHEVIRGQVQQFRAYLERIDETQAS